MNKKTNDSFYRVLNFLTQFKSTQQIRKKVKYLAVFVFFCIFKSTHCKFTIDISGGQTITILKQFFEKPQVNL